jgi:hypothetical protein
VCIHFLKKASWSQVSGTLHFRRDQMCAITFLRKQADLWSLVLSILEEIKCVHSIPREGNLVSGLCYSSFQKRSNVCIHFLKKASWSLVLSILDKIKCVHSIPREGNLVLLHFSRVELCFHVLQKASWPLVLYILEQLNCAFNFYRRESGLWSLVLSILEPFNFLQKASCCLVLLPWSVSNGL